MRAFSHTDGGRKMFYPVLRGAQKVLDQQFSHFVAPLPVINDRPLTSSKALGTKGGGFQQRTVLDFNREMCWISILMVQDRSYPGV